MKHSRRAPSVTSLPQSPQDEASRRVRRYAITMGIRTVCFVLMAVVDPVHWWTFVFAAGAIVLPYLAVVAANAGSDSTPSTVESPALQLEAPPATQVVDSSTVPGVITIHENRDTGGAPRTQDDGADGRTSTTGGEGR